ncbi:MAG TPA: hypothetical protein DIU37_02980 [Opitutae bacterium]|nr:hypothetical protein [Opitutae bacterium]|tara:strand:+ start:384 stop:914 length:531 start_codon:yes stop_codon:yes gene_type:complete
MKPPFHHSQYKSPVPITDLRIGITVSTYYGELAARFIQCVYARLDSLGIATESQTALRRVPGAFELPYIASQMSITGFYDVVIVLGIIVDDGSRAASVLADKVVGALMQVSVDDDIPLINGVLLPKTLQEAQASIDEHGAAFADAAIAMARHKCTYDPEDLTNTLVTFPKPPNSED